MNIKTSPIETLKSIMKDLRDPKTGCPWDIEQNYKSIMPYTIEEAYEVADAIEANDFDAFKDELGDLLLQVIYHTQMASEEGHFTFDDVAEHVSDKMVSRHPHVFGNAHAENADAVDIIWEAQKKKETGSAGALDTLTKGLPALLRAQKIQKKAAKTGFQWPSSNQAFEKIVEEIQEFKDAKTSEDKEEEFGDLLFALTNYARMEGIHAEEALRKANKKFIKRFQGMERDSKESNINFNDLSLDKMIESWNNQK